MWKKILFFRSIFASVFGINKRYEHVQFVDQSQREEIKKHYLGKEE